MNDVKVFSALVQKRTEGVQDYIFQCLQDNNPVIPEDKYIYKASFATEESLAKVIKMRVEDGLLAFDSKQILDLPAGTYRLELWETVDDVIHAIYPSDRNLEFRVLSNSLDLPTGKVSSLTLDEFKKEFDDIAKRVSTGQFDAPRFKAGKVESVSPDQPATVEMLTNEDGSVTINYKIPRGKDGKTWKPYIADDGYWHVREEIKEEN